jgi:protein ImuB
MLRQAGVQELELVCRHERRADTVLKLGFAKPSRDAGRMQLLLRETLGRTRLPAAVHTIILRAPLVLPLSASCGDLFQKSSEADGDLLLERLRIRLGKEAVYGIETAADHRPENAWRPCQEQSSAMATANRHRPLWLLPKPLPCHDGRLKLTSGPERIESGWWDGDGGDVARDYYVAEDKNGAHLWVYCDRTSGEWYVHVVFA